MNFCYNCNKGYEETVTFCPDCGTETIRIDSPNADIEQIDCPKSRKKSAIGLTLSIIGLQIGIMSFFIVPQLSHSENSIFGFFSCLIFFLLNFSFSLLGILFSKRGNIVDGSNAMNSCGRKMSIAGIIISCIILLFALSSFYI